ncbi:hypothetical protein [Citrobacter braakii]|jgi:hypothetical protein|uniref:hypothetical protein n=1 Tax=Citrobacter braakii TaxID=57706 RepID=UPI002964F951|nr:hypothetical protein [Citrobacter braakii]MDW2592607.1 hypothetical protein [Citrobacter braakii]MDW2656530.1 hypothetical protein [Citrobacter braakii]MDW2704245.1 hypothetical protein [Citrobacter braakii]
MDKYEHIHYAGDGRRGAREVYLNGERIEHVTYADTKKGIVRYNPHPLRFKPNGDIQSRTLRGVVEVIFVGGYVGDGGETLKAKHSGLDEDLADGNS